LRRRALRLARRLRKAVGRLAEIAVLPEKSQAGGGSLPERELPTWVVALSPLGQGPGVLEERLRRGSPPVIGRIRDDRLLLDLRTLSDPEIPELVRAVAAALGAEHAPD